LQPELAGRVGFGKIAGQADPLGMATGDFIGFSSLDLIM
jgi:hypothetical protein